MYEDRILTCRDCGREFTFTAGEQEFFAGRGFTNAPSRCPDCRAARRNGQGSSSQTRSTENYETVCANCGRPTSVPFVPRADRPVYCNECYQTMRPQRESHGGYSRTGGSGGYNRSGGNRGGYNDRPRRDNRW
jgi:CxxC-x17-CxxC domain-containing protein